MTAYTGKRNHYTRRKYPTEGERYQSATLYLSKNEERRIKTYLTFHQPRAKTMGAAMREALLDLADAWERGREP